MLRPPPHLPPWASGLVTGVHMDIKQQVNSDYDWSAPSSPALDQKNMSLHIGIKSEVGGSAQIKQVMGINYLKPRVHFDRDPKIVLKV